MNNSVRSWDDETMTLAEQFQKDCHQVVEEVLRDEKKMSYQDATNIFLFNKLAELQIQINDLKTFLK